MSHGIFVTGTDTGVGKTLVSCAIARGLVKRRVDVGVMKPIETGVTDEGPLDALALLAASNSGDDLAEVCPQQFALPAAPNIAAAAEMRRVELARVRQSWSRLMRHEFMIVEGAGGLLVPILESDQGVYDMGDLALQLELPLVLVARTALGTINHTLLSLREIERREIPLAGVIFCHSSGVLSPADRANFAHLRGAVGKHAIGEVPHLRPGELPPEDSIDLSRLIRRSARGGGGEFEPGGYPGG
jgi:dethiobiotin synthetase